MGDILKALAALVLGVAVFRYAVTSVVNKAIANSDGTASGFEFETKPLEFPNSNLNLNGNLSLNSGLYHPQEEDGRRNEPAAAPRDDRPQANEAAAVRQRKLSERVRQMHEAIRNGADPKLEMERFRVEMRAHPAN